MLFKTISSTTDARTALTSSSKQLHVVQIAACAGKALSSLSILSRALLELVYLQNGQNINRQQRNAPQYVRVCNERAKRQEHKGAEGEKGEDGIASTSDLV